MKTFLALVTMLGLLVGCDRGRGRDPDPDGGGDVVAPSPDAGADAGDAGGPTGDAGDAGGPTGDAGDAGCDRDPAACGYPSRQLELRNPLSGVSITDEVTGRVLPVVVRAPRQGGPYPVVLFEHGGGLRADGQDDSAAWGTLIASHGYVVVHVGHPDTDPATFAAVCEQAGTTLEECQTTETVHAVARVLDLVAVLDDLGTIAAALQDDGGPASDVARVAMVGWSGGSQGAVTLFGAVRELSATVPRFSRTDPRPVATVLLSPSGPGFHQFFAEGDENSWSTLRGATLMITGDNDQKPDLPDLTGAVRRQAFDLAPADGTHRLLYSRLPVGVGGHGTYNLEDRASDDPRLVRLTAAVASVTLAFLDEQLEQDPEGSAYLASDRARQLAGDASFEQR